MKISDHHLLYKSPKIKCSNRPLVTYLIDINCGYFLTSANGTVTFVPILEDTISELPSFQTTRIHGYDDWLLTHSDQLEPYTMLEIFCDVHDTMQELKYLQMEMGNVFLGIDRALGATLKSMT